VAEIENAALRRSIEQALRQVIDPETNADVMRMRLVEELVVEEDGSVRYTFRPSSPFCPIAVYLAAQVKGAVAQVPGVTGQRITVEGYVAAEELAKLLNQEA
jgi:metal-sulfur cluster biosynthetic enzyme